LAITGKNSLRDFSESIHEKKRVALFESWVTRLKYLVAA
jgi:hypothetical protein